MSALPLRDVLTDHWAWREVTACAEAGIVKGRDDGAYRPTVTVTRDQMAAFLARGLAGGEDLIPPGPETPHFTDIPPTFWAYKHIEYAYAQLVAAGYGDGTFRPGMTVNRGQVAGFVARSMVPMSERPGLAGYTPPPTPSFSDVPPDFVFYSAIEYLNEQGVIHGFDDGRYHPQAACTRAQMAVFLARAFDLP